MARLHAWPRIHDTLETGHSSHIARKLVEVVAPAVDAPPGEDSSNVPTLNCSWRYAHAHNPCDARSVVCDLLYLAWDEADSAGPAVISGDDRPVGHFGLQFLRLKAGFSINR
jgi:hypothetical protein